MSGELEKKDVHQLSTVCPFSRMERADIII